MSKKNNIADELELSKPQGKLHQECKVDMFCNEGLGWQKLKGVRLTHLPTGITVSCNEKKSSHLNLQECLNILATKINDEEHKF